MLTHPMPAGSIRPSWHYLCGSRNWSCRCLQPEETMGLTWKRVPPRLARCHHGVGAGGRRLDVAGRGAHDRGRHRRGREEGRSRGDGRRCLASPRACAHGVHGQGLGGLQGGGCRVDNTPGAGQGEASAGRGCECRHRAGEPLWIPTTVMRRVYSVMTIRQSLFVRFSTWFRQSRFVRFPAWFRLSLMLQRRAGQGCIQDSCREQM